MARNPHLEIVGVRVSSVKKVKKDVGETSDIKAIDIAATNDVEALIAIFAECAHFTPAFQTSTWFAACSDRAKTPFGRLVSTTERTVSRTLAGDRGAYAEGGATLHGCGIHPGFAGDLLPLTLTRIMESIDHIYVYEVIDFLTYPSDYIPFIGFGTCEPHFVPEP